MLNPSNHYDRNSVYDFSEGHRGVDDTGAYAMNLHRIDDLRLAAEQREREFKEATERNRVLMESGNHFAQCRGHSCRQGRVACREACNRPAEGILVHDDAQTDKPPLGWWGRHFGWLLG
jgi:hypothetical protein